MMKKHIPLKSLSLVFLTGGLLLNSASADRYSRHGGIGHAISQVERASDTLFNDYKRELQHRGLWKPRGGYSTVYSAVFRMEEYGDALRKYYERRANPSSLARVAHKIEQQVHHAERSARGCRLSGQFHANLNHLSRVTHSLIGACGTHRSPRVIHEEPVYRSPRGGSHSYHYSAPRGYLRETPNCIPQERVYRPRRSGFVLRF